MSEQQAAEKIATVGAGVCGISLSLFDIASIAQAIGMIVGCLLVSGQFVIFCVGLYKRRNG